MKNECKNLLKTTHYLNTEEANATFKYADSFLYVYNIYSFTVHDKNKLRDF